MKKAEDLQPGCYTFRLDGMNYTGDDLPVFSKDYIYGTCNIYKRGNTSIVVILYSEGTNSPMVINSLYKGNWTGWQKYVTDSDLGKAKFAEFRSSEFFNNPLGLLKNKWENLAVDSTYLVRLVCGNTYLATVLKWTEHTYGSVFIIGYELSEPIYANLNNGVWTEKTLATK